MAKTQAQLAKSVLLKFGVIDANATPAAADSELIISEYLDKLEDWRDENVVYWPANAIPEVVYQTIVKLMVNEVQNAFGVSSSPEDMMARETVLLKRLRRHAARGRSGASIRAVYY